MQTSNFERQVVLDTETTGMNTGSGEPYLGHRIIEIGAVEVINRRLTGRHFHVYIKPDRPVDPEAIEVHGITDEFLADKPTFTDVVDEFIEFVKDAELVIHNAPFDVGFINYEFSKLEPAPKPVDQISHITDSLVMARNMYPGKRNNLDTLSDRLGIDNSKRTLHGALLDAEILAEVYLAMTGGQSSLFDMASKEENESTLNTNDITTNINAKILKTIKPNDEELSAHEDYLKLIQERSDGSCAWLKN